MAVKTYKKNAPVQLSTNFNSYEFRCGIGRGCSCNDTLIDLQLVEWLERIRTHFGGRKITITSAYRCPSYNAATSGAATGSRHTKGEAIDFVVEGVAPRVVAAYCESIGIKGIGLYETQADGFFVHIDTRTYKSFWYGQAQAARTTFGGAGGATPPVNGSTTGVTTAVSGSSDMLFKGCSGEAVKQLQLDLIALKCDCGPDGADGIFGADTEKAVKKFQGENNPPDCGIFDGVSGIGNPGGPCQTCPFNKFGSGEGKAKACKNRRMLYVLREGEVFPLMLNLPTGSLKEFTNYVKHQAAKGRRLNQVVTKISIRRATSGEGMDFSQAQFAFERMLTAEERAVIAQMTEQVKSYSGHLGTAALVADEDNPFVHVDPETGEIIENDT